MHFTKTTRWAAAAFVAAGLTAALGTAPATASADRAFRGSAEGTIEFTGATTATITGSGNGSHLGTYTRVEHVTINGGAVEGDITLTADTSGDRIFISFVGGFVSGNDIAGTYTITGGTGRFEGATGEAEFEANTPDFVHMTASWDGAIDF